VSQLIINPCDVKGCGREGEVAQAPFERSWAKAWLCSEHREEWSTKPKLKELWQMKYGFAYEFPPD
jgi:hypothetical protein